MRRRRCIQPTCTANRLQGAFFPLLGVLQNDEAPLIIDNPPLFDLLQGSKAAETGKVIVQAAISYARGFRGIVDITH